jgi:hypothetical protein
MRAKVALLLTSTTNYEFGCCISSAVRALDVIRIGRNPRRTAWRRSVGRERFIPVVVVRCGPTTKASFVFPNSLLRKARVFPKEHSARVEHEAGFQALSLVCLGASAAGWRVHPLLKGAFHALRCRRDDHHIAVFVCVYVPILHVFSRA